MSPGIHVTPKVDYTSFDFDRRKAPARVFIGLCSAPCPIRSWIRSIVLTRLIDSRAQYLRNSVAALAMLNDQFITRYSEHFAERLERDRPGNRDAQIRLAIDLTFNRSIQRMNWSRYRPFVQKDGLPEFLSVLFNSE
jgi:hypothetical protein